MKVVITMDTKKSKEEMIDFAHVSIITDDGVKQVKKVTISSLVEVLSGSQEGELNLIRTGKLPRGYYDGKIYQDKQDLNGEIVIVLPKNRQIFNYRKEYHEISMPSLVFHFKVVHHIIKSTCVYSMKDNIPNDSSMLYYYPFGNVSLYTNEVCWGANMRKITNLKDLDEFVTLFLQAPTNDDYYTPGKSCSELMEQYQLIELLEDREEFPDEWLVGTANKKILGKLIN